MIIKQKKVNNSTIISLKYYEINRAARTLCYLIVIFNFTLTLCICLFFTSFFIEEDSNKIKMSM